MMICDDCQGEMERDTVIFMIAVRGRQKAMHQPGWFCWTCKVSRHAAGDELVEQPKQARRAAGRPPV